MEAREGSVRGRERDWMGRRSRVWKGRREAAMCAGRRVKCMKSGGERREVSSRAVSAA